MITVKKAYRVNKSVIDDSKKIKKFKITKQKSEVSNSVCLPSNLKIRAASVITMKKKFVVKTP